MKTLLKRSAWGLVVLAILTVLAWTTVNVVGAARVSSSLQALQGAGFATSAGQLTPPPLPADRNAAPFYSAAFALVFEPDGALLEAYEEILDKGAEAVPAERRKAVRDWLNANADALVLLERARTRPGCRFERNYADGFAMLLPELGPAMRLGAQLQVRAALQAESGEAAGARASVESMLGIADSLKEDPPLVSQLVRMAVIGRALTAIERAVTPATAEAELRAWRTVAKGIEVPPGLLADAFRMELAVGADLVRKGMSDPSLFVPAGGDVSGESILFALGWPFIRLSAPAYLNRLRQAAEAADPPSWEAFRRLEPMMTSEFRNEGWLCAMLLPGSARSLDELRALASRAAVVVAGLDAELARRTSGAYPEKIEAVDPATGNPLIYDRAEGRIASAADSKEKPIEWRLRQR